MSTKASLPRSALATPSAARLFSTTICVAMPAWSVPGIHSTSLPHILACLAMISSIVTNMAWPICSAPVTLGGGMAITNFPSSAPDLPSIGRKHPSDSHQP